MSPETWFYERAGQRLGPFTRDDLAGLVKSGLLMPATIVVCEDGSQVQAGVLLADVIVAQAVPDAPSGFPPPPPLPSPARDAASIPSRGLADEHPQTANHGGSLNSAPIHKHLASLKSWLHKNQVFRTAERRPGEDVPFLAGIGSFPIQLLVGLSVFIGIIGVVAVLLILFGIPRGYAGAAARGLVWLAVIAASVFGLIRKRFQRKQI